MPSKPNGARRQQTGIRPRHSRTCATSSGGDCNCRPAWEASVYLRREGKKVRKSFATLAEARSWRHDAGAAAGKGALRAPIKLTLDQAAVEWFAGARVGTIRNRSGDAYKPSVLRSYDQALAQRVLPDLGGHRLADIRRPDLQALVGRLQARGLDPSTIRNALAPVRVIYRHHADDISVNPTVGLRLPAVRGRRDRIADPTEAQALLGALELADRAIYGTAMYAGLRLGELRALRWSDIDLAGGLIRVERAWDDREGLVAPKSIAGTRRVPIVPVLRDLLADLRPIDADGLALGDGDRPFHAGALAKRATKAWQAAGLNRITLHECRHTFASLMIAAGVNAKALATYIGHSSVLITFDRYGHLMPGNEAEAAGLLDAYLTRADTAARLVQLDA
jgi:integrase